MNSNLLQTLSSTTKLPSDLLNIIIEYNNIPIHSRCVFKHFLQVIDHENVPVDIVLQHKFEEIMFFHNNPGNMGEDYFKDINVDSYNYASFMVVGIDKYKKFVYLHLVIDDENDFYLGCGNYKFQTFEAKNYTDLLDKLPDNTINFIDNNIEYIQTYIDNDSCTCNPNYSENRLKWYDGEKGLVEIPPKRKYCLNCDCHCEECTNSDCVIDNYCYCDNGCLCQDITCECPISISNRDKLNKTIPRPL